MLYTKAKLRSKKDKLPKKNFSASVKRSVLLVKASSITTRKFCWYFMGVGGQFLPDLIKCKIFKHRDFNIGMSSFATSLQDGVLRHIILMGTISRGFSGTEMMTPCGKIPQLK